MTLIPDIDWCEVPAGEFIMGSDDSKWDNERPQHTVNLPYSYKAAKYPVTNAQYGLFVEAGGYNKRQYWTAAGWGWKEANDQTDVYNDGEPFNLPNHPVVGVSWYEAVAYCRWLTEVLRGCGELAEGWLIRLPTEAEWEKAARGEDGRSYPWGEGFDIEKANGKETEVKSTNAVGIFPDGASPYGCHEMAGNVWEWCTTKGSFDDYKPYPYQVENEWTEAYLEGKDSGVSRGGAWKAVTETLRCACRNDYTPGGNTNVIGFRCFCVPIEGTEARNVCGGGATVNGERNEGFYSLISLFAVVLIRKIT